MNTFEKIRKIRREKEMTQEYLAKKIGMTKQTISDYEKNKKEPKFSVLVKICKELGINISDIVTEFEGK